MLSIFQTLLTVYICIFLPANAFAAEFGTWTPEEIVGWSLLALAPVFVFILWKLFLGIKQLRQILFLSSGIHSSHDAMAVVSRKHTYLAVNTAYCRLLDIEPEQVIGRSVTDIWGEERYQSAIRPALERCFRGETIRSKAMVDFPKQQGRILEVGFHPVFKRGIVRQVTVFLVDVTRRTQAEARLRERETLYETLVQSSNSVILRMTPEGRLSFINTFGLQFFGYTEDEIIGSHLFGLILPETDSKGRDLHQMWSGILSDVDRYSINANENIKKNGERVWLLWSNQSLRDEQGNIKEILCIGHDVTPLMKSRHELEALRQALDQAGSGMAVTDLQGHIRYANPAWAKMHGYENPTMLPQHNIGTFFVPLSEEHRLEDMLAQVRTEGVYQAEIQHVARDGTTFISFTTMSLLRDPAGDPDGLVVMAVDMSERKQLLADLDRNRKRLRVIVDNINDIVFSLTPTGRFSYVSPAVQKLFGYAPEEVEGRHFAALTHPEDIPLCESLISGLQQNIETTRAVELRGRRKDGTDIWLVNSFSGILDEHGNLNQIVGVAHDMTELRAMTQMLEESQERFHELVKAIEEAYWLQDGQRLLYTSPGFEPIFGISGAELRNDPSRLRFVVHPDDLALAENLWNGKRTSWTLQDITLRVLLPGGGHRWVRARTFPVLRNGKVVRTAGVAQDVTAYTEAVQDIHKAKEAAERANNVKSEFLARMGHEFRTPLNGVLGMLQLLSMDAKLDKTNADRIAEAEHSARILQFQLDRLLEYVSLESCTPDDLDAPFSLRDLLRGLEATYKPLAEQHGLTLSVDSGKNLMDLRGDAAKVRRILDQLVDNAVKFTPDGEVAVHVLQKELPNDIIQTSFKVEDSGAGIPEDQRSIIFEPFVQSDGSYTRRFGGAGLGLAIAKQLAACIDGELHIGNSTLGGALFELRAPFRKI